MPREGRNAPMLKAILILCLALTGCAKYSCDPCLAVKPESSPYYLAILVDARQLDYSCNKAFFRSLVKHPSDGSKNCDVGHAWIYLKGKGVELEGGHSGELGQSRPKYFEGIMQCINSGYGNPVQYLWESLNDGYFQEGSGGHVPTFAIKRTLTERQFATILSFVEQYPYRDYALTGRQCCSFVRKVARLAGLELECAMQMAIEPTVKVAGEVLPLWSDPFYSKIEFPCPEVLECSMREAVATGQAEYALDWYLETHAKNVPREHWFETVYKFPFRLRRLLEF